MIGTSVEINARFLLLALVTRVNSRQYALEKHGLLVPMCFIVDVGLGARNLYLGGHTHRFLPVAYSDQGRAANDVQDIGRGVDRTRHRAVEVPEFDCKRHVLVVFK